MNVQAWSRLRLVAIGLIAGALIGAARMLAASGERVGGPGFISQQQFEEALRVPPVRGKPFVRAVSIRPIGHVDILTLEIMNSALGYERTRFAAPRPYTPGGQAASPQTYETVASYLAELAAVNPELRVRPSWWEAPAGCIALYAAVGAFVIGGVWPTLMHRLAGAGLGRKEAPYDLDRLKPEPERGESKKLPTAADLKRLEELESEMGAALGSGSVATGESAGSDAPSVRQLSDEIPAAVTVQEHPDKQYAGQFYPVEKNVPHGFSLIELLVVIGVIAILISMLLPAAQMVRQQAQTVHCASKLRQLGAAFHMYAAANRGWLPAWSGWHTWPAGQSEDSEGPAWTIEMIPYLGPPDSAAYHCPSWPGLEPCRNYFLAGQWAGRSGKNAMKLTDITMTGRFVLSGDKTQRNLYPAPFGLSDHLQNDADPDDCGYEAPVLAWPWNAGGFYMHRGGNNVLFDDMHVMLFDAYDPAAMTFHPRQMQDWPHVSGDEHP